ncbi:hypothetical protein RC30_08685 [Campylobacter jejuni]|nr:hypothetical protein RC30_08685 [Campylobacter jejuni]
MWEIPVRLVLLALLHGLVFFLGHGGLELLALLARLARGGGGGVGAAAHAVLALLLVALRGGLALLRGKGLGVLFHSDATVCVAVYLSRRIGILWRDPILG